LGKAGDTNNRDIALSKFFLTNFLGKDSLFELKLLMFEQSLRFCKPVLFIASKKMMGVVQKPMVTFLNFHFFTAVILDNLLQRENQVLRLWNARKSAMELWQQYQVAVETILKWLQSAGWSRFASVLFTEQWAQFFLQT